MRALLGCALGLLLCGGLSAEDKKGGEKIDAQKLVGKWQPKQPPKGVTVLVEFTKDGKMTVDSTAEGGAKLQDQSAYKLEGNRLTMTTKAGGKEETRTRTVTRLTDSELVLKDEKGGEQALVRVKGK